jgi:hypothetical protein
MVTLRVVSCLVVGKNRPYQFMIGRSLKNIFTISGPGKLTNRLSGLVTDIYHRLRSEVARCLPSLTPPLILGNTLNLPILM